MDEMTVEEHIAPENDAAILERFHEFLKTPEGAHAIRQAMEAGDKLEGDIRNARVGGPKVESAESQLARAPKQGWPLYVFLRQWAFAVAMALDVRQVYQVGSSVTRKDWRDIDVVVILPDDKFKEMFPLEGSALDWKWQGLCAAFSCWGEKALGANVDFKIQAMSRANTFSGPRNALVFFPEKRETTLDDNIAC